MNIYIALMTIILFLLIVLIVKIFFPKNSNEYLDIKNEIIDLKTRQLENQNKSILEQQRLLTASQEALSKQLAEIIAAVNTHLSQSQTLINTQLTNANAIISEVKNKLGVLEETTRNIQEIGKDISSLQDILQAPKLRGNLGEFLLEELLKQIFPSQHYQMQYQFSNGVRVDAVIKLGNGLVPVDSKFPLNTFQRIINAHTQDDAKQYKKEFIQTVKKLIDDISQKYINQNEGTLDFALMYIPAENVFYETIISDSFSDKQYELLNYAIQKRVIPVSPNSFYAYLMAIGYGLKGLQIEQKAKLILGYLGQIKKLFIEFINDFALVGRHIENAMNKYRETQNKADKLIGKMDNLLDQHSTTTENTTSHLLSK